MKLLKLKLKDFKGIKSLEIEPNGSDVSLYGTNGTGKTTVFDSVTWLLFGKGSTDAPDFNPKTVGFNGEELHGLVNTVEGTFALDESGTVTFRKEFHEIWTRKRGNAEQEYAGNTTDYYIDGVPVKKGEYDARIADICPVDRVKILTSPLYFSEDLSWQERRRVLLEVCGDITDEEVICSTTELYDLIGYLRKPGGDGNYTVEEYRKIAESRQKEINRRLQELPCRIDEVTLSMPDVSEIDAESTQRHIEELRKKLDKAFEKKAGMNEQSATAEMRGQMGALKLQLQEKKLSYQQHLEDLTDADRDEMATLRCRKKEVEDRISILDGTIDSLCARLSSMKEQRGNMTAEYETLKNQEWDGEKICPTCKQELPGAELAHIITTFNINKSRQLEDIRNRMKRECSKEMIADLESQIEGYEKDQAVLHAESAALTRELVNVSDRIKDAMKVPFEATAEATELSLQIAELEKKLSNVRNSMIAEHMEAQSKIDTMQKDLDGERKKLQLLDSAERQRVRLEELEAEEKKLNNDYEDCFRAIYLCEQFVKAKTAMLDEHINAMFDGVRFRLFDTQINGGLKEICEVLVPSEMGQYVPYSKTNAAAKMNAGLSIIDTLSRHFGVSMPVFVDNAESVVKLQNIKPQLIRLVVSKDDLKLRMEVDV